MKNHLVSLGLVASLLAPLALALPAQATVTPSWDVTGTYVININYLSVDYPENLVLSGTSAALTGTLNLVTPPGGSPWTIDSGSVVGSIITLHGFYNSNPSMTIHMTGVIAADGSMSGTWGDDAPGTRTGTWVTTSGTANIANVPDWGQQLSAARCVGKSGSPVVNVTEKVINDVDSGMAGNNWAFDNYTRHIQVWQIGKTAGTYCALVTYEGSSSAVVGQTGPGGTGVIGDGVSAEMKGGYRSINFAGTLLVSPSWKTRGSVGTVDYACDISGTCPGRVSWLNQYFSSNSFDYAWWGWFYWAGSHGSWLNSSEGTFGNIL